MKNIQAFIIGLLTILFFGAAMSSNAATWTVTKAANSSDNVCDADCSLREAVFNADSGDTVIFNSNLIGQTFTLGGSEIVITKRITIDGNLDGVNVAFISGSNTSRIFLIQTGGGLNLRNAILVQGNAIVGGAIRADDATVLSLNRVAVRGNFASFLDGAISLGNGNCHITNSSITGNSAPTRIAIGKGSGNLYMANVTVSGNFDSDGGLGAGAIYNFMGSLEIRNSTITNNTTTNGSGIYNGGLANMTIGNTIVAQNTAQGSGADIYNFGNGVITSAGGNLIGDLDTVPANTFNQPNDISGVNPLLGPTNANLGGFPMLYHTIASRKSGAKRRFERECS